MLIGIIAISITATLVLLRKIHDLRKRLKDALQTQTLSVVSIERDIVKMNVSVKYRSGDGTMEKPDSVMRHNAAQQIGHAIIEHGLYRKFVNMDTVEFEVWVAE